MSGKEQYENIHLSPRKLLSNINQENKEITKNLFITDLKLMAAGLLFVVLLLRLNWQICSHYSEKYFRIQISKLWPPRSLEIFNENCTVHKMFLKKTDLCLP